ncbi:MAG: sensor histidine kinase [Anaerolineae bacterium]
MTLPDLLAICALAAAVGTAAFLYVRLQQANARADRCCADRAEALAERQALAEALQRHRQHLVALGESSNDALLLLDENRQIVWGNRVAWDWFGDGQPALGQSFIALVRDYELNQAVADATAGHRAMMRQTVLGGRTLRIWATPVEGQRGAAVIIEDVSELQRLGRARRDFVANISHELRTPLANIDLAAQTLRNNPTDLTLARRMLDQIQTQVQLLSQLSQEIMELAQIESGQVLLRLVPAEMAAVVRSSVSHLLPQAAMKDQHLSVWVPDGLMALVDEEQIGRVISNLVHNAVKFAPEGGIISITAQAVGEDVQVCVSDTGPGIPKDEQTRIFERFYKAERARSKGGTGLGLAIARHIVEGHGGRIWVESTPGHGATFCFTVPKA